MQVMDRDELGVSLSVYPLSVLPSVERLIYLIKLNLSVSDN